jgi:hypothetical protein
VLALIAYLSPRTFEVNIDAFRRGLHELAAKIALDKSVTGRRLRDATDRGYLVNLEIRRGRPARIVLGDPMLEMVKLLPEPTELGA